MPGIPGTSIYSYNSNGLLIKINYSSGITETYEYYNDNLLKSLTRSEASSNTKLVFSYGSNKLISRVDQYNNGNHTSYRIISRDSNLFINRENFYTPTGSTIGYCEHLRNDINKTITINFYLASSKVLSYILTYDSSNFIIKIEYNQFMTNFYPEKLFEINYILQDGPFDTAGLNGYYYTDKDIYPIITYYASSYGF